MYVFILIGSLNYIVSELVIYIYIYPLVHMCMFINSLVLLFSVAVWSSFPDLQGVMLHLLLLVDQMV